MKFSYLLSVIIITIPFFKLISSRHIIPSNICMRLQSQVLIPILYLTIIPNINFFTILATLSHNTSNTLYCKSGEKTVFFSKKYKFLPCNGHVTDTKPNNCNKSFVLRYPNANQYPIQYLIKYELYILNRHWILYLYKILLHPKHTKHLNILWKISVQLILKEYRKHNLFEMANSKSMYSYSDMAKLPGPTLVTGRKPPRKPLPQAQLLQKSFETNIDKHTSTNLLDNLLELAQRGETEYLSNCIILSGLPLDHPDWPPQLLLQWASQTCQFLHGHLGITVDKQALQDYLDDYDTYTLYPESNSCSIPIPIQQKIFQLGGGNINETPAAFGVNPGGAGDLFYMYQAIPITSPLSLRDARLAVELCTFRGIPGNEHEVQSILAMILHKTEHHIAPLCQLPVNSFDTILHRRQNNRSHYNDKRKSYEFVITIYCRPEGQPIGVLRDRLLIKDSPSEIRLDWIGEVWASYYGIRSFPPSMLLLHRTPQFCIYGFFNNTTTTEIITALVADNPDLPLFNMAYCFFGLHGTLKAWFSIWMGESPTIAIGTNLSQLGATRTDGDPKDNPSMAPARELICGSLVEFQFVATGRKVWAHGLNTAWTKQVETYIGKMPTLQGGNAVGLTHVGSSVWADPTFFSSSPTVAKRALTPVMSLSSTSSASNTNSCGQSSEEILQLRERLRLQTEQIQIQSDYLAKLERLHDQTETDPNTTYMEESPQTHMTRQGIGREATADIHAHYQGIFQNMLDQQEARLAHTVRSILTNKRTAAQISTTTLLGGHRSPLRGTDGNTPEGDNTHSMDITNEE